jgi:hypothetical protein
VAWIDGEVVEVNSQDVKVLCTSGKTVSVLSYMCLFPYKFASSNSHFVNSVGVYFYCSSH